LVRRTLQAQAVPPPQAVVRSGSKCRACEVAAENWRVPELGSIKLSLDSLSDPRAQQRPIAQSQSHTKLTIRSYGKHNDKSDLVNRAADDVSNSLWIACSTGRLFSDQLGLQYCRRGQYHRSSTVEPLGDLYSSWARLLDRQQ
jgi:hypothetical protein